MPKKIEWEPAEDEDLRRLVASSTSFNMVAAKLTGNPDSYYKQVKSASRSQVSTRNTLPAGLAAPCGGARISSARR
jgi:hypothetical protein